MTAARMMATNTNTFRVWEWVTGRETLAIEEK